MLGDEAGNYNPFLLFPSSSDIKTNENMISEIVNIEVSSRTALEVSSASVNDKGKLNRDIY